MGARVAGAAEELDMPARKAKSKKRHCVKAKPWEGNNVSLQIILNPGFCELLVVNFLSI